MLISSSCPLLIYQRSEKKVLLLFFSKNMLCWYFSNFSMKTTLWYSLEASQWGTSNEYPQHMFSWRNKKNNYQTIPLWNNVSSTISNDSVKCSEKILIRLHMPFYPKYLNSYHTSPKVWTNPSDYLSLFLKTTRWVAKHGRPWPDAECCTSDLHSLLSPVCPTT